MAAPGTGAAKRKYGIDVARGVCLLLMSIDHLPDAILQRFSNVNYGPFGFFTAASGFVFLSGLVSSSVYGLAIRNYGWKEGWRRALKRAGTLYFANALIFLLCLAGVWFHFLSGPFWKSEFPLFFTNHWRALYLGLLLVYRPGLFDILPIYVFFLLMVVPTLMALRSGHQWAVVSVSVIAWAFVQFASLDPNTLHPLGYQIYFVGGLFAGCIRDFRARLAARHVSLWAKISLALAAAIAVARLWMGHIGNTAIAIPYWDRLTHLNNNGPLRMLSFALFGFGAAFLWFQLPQRFKSGLPFRWLSYLGQHSLQVFIWSILLTYASFLMMPSSAGHAWRLMNMLLVVPSLTIPAALHSALKKKAGDRRPTSEVSGMEPHSEIVERSGL